MLTRWVFLRALGAVYLVAFLSLRVQMDGLIGRDGIAPASQYLVDAFHRDGWWALLRSPSLAWIASSDAALHLLCDAGIVLAAVLATGLADGPALLGLWACYLSFTTIGGFFLDWAIDRMLLEVSFFALFLGPLALRARNQAPPVFAVFLMQLFLFRFVLMCGLTKLLSPDPAWRNLSALHFHLQTQPNPNLITWYANLLPEAVKQLATATVLVVEVLVPPLIFARRRWRRWSFVPLAGMQLAVASSGNYAWFNWLTVVAAIFTLDDGVWGRVVPRAWQPRTPEAPSARGSVRARPLVVLLVAFAAYHSVNPVYSAFSRVERERRELVLEGSIDGIAWRPYELRCKPGRVDRAPGWCEPHQPRLDWALSEAPRKWLASRPWLESLVDRLLEGSPDVLALFDGNPFPSEPPRTIRATLFRYWQPTAEERARTGAWWHREPIGTALEPVTRASIARGD